MKNLKIYMFAALCSAAVMSCEKSDNLDGSNDTKNQITSGLGGSMAQFTIIDNYLYTVDYKSLKVFHISDAANPELLETINLGVGIETIYPQNDHLFIGTQNGVRIYDVTNPRSPEAVSEIDHVTSCDPVVANDNYAVATLRGGTPCNGNLNQLDVIDISDLENPILMISEDLINPYGVGFVAENENLVYVCDGYAGLKVYDITDIENIELVMHKEDLEAIDVIPAAENLLVVLTRQGVYQFDSTNPLELVERSFISVQ
ncbi:MAG: hypothetical protein ACI8ZM_001165 [Crocinitomix sp.]|jgi:hypothetical protein